MLRPYDLFYSKIHEVQSFVNHVLLDVIFRAPKISATNFTSSLVLPKYQSLIDEVNPIYILNPLEEAFRICKVLNLYQLKTLKKAVHNNNKIRELCDGDIEPVRYEEIEKIDEKLKNALKDFCDYLYDNSIELAPFYNSYESINDYYKRIVGKSSFCRCCGINKILTQFHIHRSALDHYLPRKHYPFNSVNFKNLFPICDYCNSKYKLSIDPLSKVENKGKKSEIIHRVKAFYPFRKSDLNIRILIRLVNVKSVKSLQPDNIEMDLICPGYEEQIDTWDRTFSIKENYKAECCTSEMLSYFEEEYMAHMINNFNHDNYIKLLENNKYGNVNFLKIPFLNALSA